LETKVIKNTTPTAIQELLRVIVDSILDKKGLNVISLDLTNLDESVADYLVICEGNSPPQVRAIADNVRHEAKKQLSERPTFKEGFSTLEWVLIDYINIMVHVFLKDKRQFYKLEELWADAAITTQYFADGTSQNIS